MKTPRLPRSGFCFVEILEARIAPASHEWTGLGGNTLWSNPGNWVGGSPAVDFSGDIDLIFHSNLQTTKALVMQNDIPGLIVDSITFDANAGTNATGGKTAKGYTLNGMPLQINTGGSGAGIQVLANVGDTTKGVTETINLRLILSSSSATFTVQDFAAKLVLNGDVSLDGWTLSLDTISGSNPILTVNGDISNGNLIKSGSGAVQLAGENAHYYTTVNAGKLIVTNDLGLGLRNSGSVTINNPAQLILRDGITVEKPQLNLSSNSLNAFAAEGNTTNTFRGAVYLGNTGSSMAMGSGVGPAEAKTRLIIDGVISGTAGTLSLNGAGVIQFTQNNSYSGVTSHNGNNGFGALQLDSPGGLGVSGSSDFASFFRNGAGPNGTALWLNFDGTFFESVQFAGTGVDSTGAIRVLGDHVVTMAGNITLTAGAPWSVAVDEAGGVLTTTGVIDSQSIARPLAKTGEGMLVIGGSSANTWLGGISIADGILRVTNTSANPLGASSGLVAIYNDSTFDVRSGVTIPNTVQLGAKTTLANAGAITGLIRHSSLVLAANGKSGTYIDEDGDSVKITSSAGALLEQNFLFAFASDGHQQLQQLTLTPINAKTAINLQATPKAGSGDSLAKVGYINGTGLSLGNVTVDGDLGRITASNLGMLTANSMGIYGTGTQPSGGTLSSSINGSLAAGTGNVGGLTVKTHYYNESLIASGRIGSIKIGASWTNGRISAGADIGAVTIGENFYGSDTANPAILSAMGKAVAPTSGTDTAIASIKVGGNVGFANILAGFNTSLSGVNADASVGSVTVNGAWFASNLLAGARPGPDTLRGTTDDEKLTGGSTRDKAQIFSKIGAIVIKGTADGSSLVGDHFGIMAELITSAKINTTKLTFTSGPRDASDFHIVGPSYGDLGIGEITH